MVNSDTCQTRVISDDPATSDQFGAHERLARALVEVLQIEEGGKAIALEGPWGTGKSTVVNLLQAALSSDNDFAVVVFDAWAHQGDPLRRSFLEKLTDSLKKRGWLNDANVAAKIGELSRKQVEVISRTVPVKSWLVEVFSMAVFLVPLGIAFLGSGLNDGVTFKLGGGVAGKFLVGLLLAISPFFIVAGYSLWRFRKLQIRRRSPKQAISGKHVSAPAFWGLFSQQRITKTKTTSAEFPNPTSVEFESLFNLLLTKSLKNSDQRLLIILDNLDRVASSDALSILSTLQTFVSLVRDPGQTWLNQVWVLVPYDIRGIARLWDPKQSKAFEPTDADPAGDIGVSFVEKMFHLRFEVPPLVLSDWREYLLGLLKQAMPDHPEADFHLVYRVCNIARYNGRHTPTPRDFKHFVNQIGIVHRQRKHEIPLQQVAYYVILRMTNSNIPTLLTNREFIDQRLSGILGEDVRDNLAGLWFNVPVSKARQVWLQAPLEAALGAREIDTLDSQLANFPNGFWITFEQLTFKDWANKEPIVIANAAYWLHENGLLSSIDNQLSGSIVRNLRVASLAVLEWRPFSREMAEGLAALIQLIPEPLVTKTVLDTVTKLPIPSDPASEFESQSKWVEGLLLILRIVKARDTAEIPGSIKLVLQGSALDYFNACSFIVQFDPKNEFWHFFLSNLDSSELESAITALIQNGGFAQRNVDSIRFLMASGRRLDWPALVKRMVGRLQRPKECSTIELVALLRGLWLLHPSGPDVDDWLVVVSRQGHLVHHLCKSEILENTEALAWCLATFFAYFKRAQLTPDLTTTTRSFATNLQILNLSYSGIVDALLEQLAVSEVALPFAILDTHEATILASCLREAADTEKPQCVFPLGSVIKHWHTIHSNLERPAFRDFLTAIERDSNLTAALTASDFMTSDLGLCATVLATLESLSPDFVIWCRDGLFNATGDYWLRSLDTGSGLGELAVALIDRRFDFNLSGALQTALREHKAKVAIAGASLNHVAMTLDRLINPTSNENPIGS